MAAKIDIWNMALGLVGCSATILDESENTQEARWCRIYYDQCRDELFEMRPWSFMERRAALQDLGDAPDEWSYRYAYPSFCVRINALIAAGQRNPRKPHPFKIQSADDSYGKCVLTDLGDAVAIYNHRSVTEDQFSAAFVRALALSLAASVASPLRVDAALAQRAELAYAAWVNEAGSSDMAQQREDDEPETSILASRR